MEFHAHKGGLVLYAFDGAGLFQQRQGIACEDARVEAVFAGVLVAERCAGPALCGLAAGLSLGHG